MVSRIKTLCLKKLSSAGDEYEVDDDQPSQLLIFQSNISGLIGSDSSLATLDAG